MKPPIIIAIDDDQAVLQAIQRDLRQHYRKNYKILATTSANEALETLVELKKKNEEVALFLSDQRMPDMLGVDFCSKPASRIPTPKPCC
jgi:thioredoxin reductase (NADPH)